MFEPYDVKINGNDFLHLVDGKYEIPVIEGTVHPYDSRRIAIIYPGANGSKDGYMDKYKKMAENLVEERICAVLRVPNTYHIGNGWTIGLEMAIEYAIKHAVEICKGNELQQIFMIGHSAGAGAISLVASAYEQITKVVLTSPAPLRRHNKIEHMIGEFTGGVYVAIGEEDRVVPRDEAKDFYNLATSSVWRTLNIIPNCDHEWSGDNNLKSFIKAPAEMLLNSGSLNLLFKDIKVHASGKSNN